MKSNLSLIFFFIVKFIKSWNDVKFNEELGTSQMIESLLQLRNEVLIFNNDVVKFLIIHTYLNIFFRFADKNHQKADEECVEVYKFFLKILIQSLLKHFELISDYKI